MKIIRIIKECISELNEEDYRGDWVTINPSYAKEHGVNNLRNKYRIIGKTVSAKNLQWDGGDINEIEYYA